MDSDSYVDVKHFSLTDCKSEKEWTVKKLYPNIYEVYIDTKPTNYLLKLYTKKKYALREKNALDKLSDLECVPKLVSSCVDIKYDEKNYNHNMITRIPGCDLYDWMKNRNLNFLELKEISYKLLKALYHIHKRGVIHGDIKPENIMYDGKNLSLIDFESKSTDQYRSPEQIRCENNITAKTDIWSAGILIYNLANGSEPFETDDDALSDDVKFPKMWKKKIPSFVSMLEKFLQKNPKKRPSARKALKLSWFLNK